MKEVNQLLSCTNMYTGKKKSTKKLLVLAVGRRIWRRRMLLSRWEVPNAPSQDGRAEHTSQQGPTSSPHVSPHEKAPWQPGFSVEGEQIPVPALNPDLKEHWKDGSDAIIWQGCYYCKTLLQWSMWSSFAFIFLLKGTIAHECWFMGALRQNCRLTQADFESYSKAGTSSQTNRLIFCGWSHPNPTCSSIYWPWLSEKWELLSCLLKNIKENRGNWLPFSSYKLISSEHPKWGLNT